MEETAAVRQKNTFARLQSQCQRLTKQLAQLQQTHCSLIVQNSILATLCDSLSYYQVCSRSGQQQQWQEQEEGCTAEQQEQLTSLLAAEGQLLRQLQHLPASSDFYLLQAASRDGRGFDTIAPADDPMSLYKEAILASAATRDTAQSVTSMDMTMMYKAVIQQVSIALHLMDTGVRPYEACAADLRSAWMDSFWPTQLSCMLAGRSDMMREFETRDAATLQPIDPAAPPDRLAAVAAALDHMHLTAAQEQVIAQQAAVWLRLLNPVNEELKILQQQVSHTPDGTPLGAGAGSTVGGSNMPDGSSDRAAMNDGAVSHAPLEHSVLGRAAALEDQLQRLERLKVVMHKKRIVNIALYCWLLGRLSWQQVSRLAVLTWPHPTSVEHVWLLVQQRWEARQQQEQERQQQWRRQQQQQQQRAQKSLVRPRQR